MKTNGAGSWSAKYDVYRYSFDRFHAGAFQVDVAQRGNIDADLLAGFENGCALWHLQYMIVYCKLNHFLFHDESAVRLENLNCVEVAARLAHTATDTLIRINDVWLAHVADDSVGRTILLASSATLALLRIDCVGKQRSPGLLFPSIRVFLNESVLPIRCPEYWSFSFSISPSNEY